MTDPSQDQIDQARLNINNLLDWINHVHDYLQDVINEVYDKVNEQPNYDPMQKFVTNLMDSTLWSIGGLNFPGASVISSFLGTFFGSYSGPDTPPALDGAFGSVWARFDATFLQANTDLSVVYGDIKGNWNKSYTNPVTGAQNQVSDLGTGAVKMPGKDELLFQQMTNAAVASYRLSLTSQTLGLKWFVLQDPKGLFVTWTEAAISTFSHGFVQQHPAYMVTYHPDKGGNILCPQNGFMLLENFLGTGSNDPYFAGEAPGDLCSWLFKDDGYGTVTNANALASRRDVFFNWGLAHSLKSTPQDIVADGADDNENMEAEKKKALRWLALFNQTPRQEVEKMIVRKAGQDPVFLEQLFTDSKKTLETFLGLSFPQVGFELVREKPGEYILVLPLVGAPTVLDRVGNVTSDKKMDDSPAVADFNATFFSGIETRQEMENRIIQKSQQDGVFLRDLVREPAKTLSAFLNLAIPANTTIEVLQETPGNYKMVFPQVAVVKMKAVTASEALA